MTLQIARKTFWTLLFCIANCFAFGQTSKEAKKHWTKAITAIAEGNYKTAFVLGAKTFDSELATPEDKLDNRFLQTMCTDMAKAYRKIGRWDSAIFYYNRSYIHARKLNDSDAAVQAIFQVNACYAKDRKDTVEFDLQKMLGTEEVGTREQYCMFRVKSLKDVRYAWYIGDTCWFWSRGGTNDGVYIGSPVGFHSIYKPGYRKRPFKYYGSGKVTYVESQRSYGYFIFKTDFIDTMYLRDGFYTATKIPAYADKNSLFYSTAILGFSSENEEDSNYNIYPTTSLYYTDAFASDAILRNMQKRVNQLGMNKSKYAEIEFKDTITEGRFVGMTYKQALQVSTMLDIKHYLNMVSTYSSTYDNFDSDFLYSYLFWLQNGSYIGYNEKILWQDVKKTSASQFTDFAKTYFFYYGDRENLDSIWGSWIDTFSTGIEVKINTAKKILQFAKIHGKNDGIGFWTKKISILYHDADNMDSAYLWSKAWLATGYSTTYIFANLSSEANMLHKFNEAIAYSDSILLNEAYLRRTIDSLSADWMIEVGLVEKGFALLMTGRVKPAIPYLYRAFQMDSSRRFTRFTYANGLALEGNMGEARRLYDVCMTMLTDTKEFGYILKDLNMFIQNGSLESFFQGEKTRLTQIYKSKYKYSLLVDSLRDVGFYLRKNQSDYEGARLRYAYALDTCLKYLPKDSAKQVFLLDWLGYIAIELDSNRMALNYYKQAVDICIKYKFSTDKILAEYGNITYTANLLGNTDEYRQYKLLEDEVKRRLADQKQKKLVLFSCGLNTSLYAPGVTEKYAESDAMQLASAMQNSAVRYFDTVINYQIVGKGLTYDSLRNTFRKIIDLADENDVFMFYYAGPTHGKSANSYLSLADDYFTVSEISGYLSQIISSKQVLVFDGGNMPVDSLHSYLRRYNTSFVSSISTAFLCNRGWREEDDASKHGMLTGALLNYLNKTEGESKMTAQAMFHENQGNAAVLKFPIPIQSIVQGYEIVLGKRILVQKGRDTLAPKIELYNTNARTFRGENLLLKPGAKRDLSGIITDDRGIKFAFINGKKLNVLPNGRFSYPLALLQSDTIEIMAYDENNNTDSLKAVLLKESNTTPLSNRKIAWFIAINDFDNWKPLCNPINDAIAISSLLKNNYGYEVHNCFNLTYEDLLTKIDSINGENYKPGEQLFIYIASHGYYHNSRGSMVVCKNSEATTDNRFIHYYSLTELRRAVTMHNCKNAFLVMDLCYAGAVADESNSKPYYMPVQQGKLSDDEFIKRQKEILCHQFLISGRKNPVDDGDCIKGGVNHSPFAQAIIQNLSNALTNKSKKYLNFYDFKFNLPQTGVRADWRPVYGYFDLEQDAEYVFEVIRNSTLPVGPESPQNTPVAEK